MLDETLIIRADANIATGTGHVMRCLALAQAWQDRGGSVVFAMADSTAAIDKRLRAEGMEIVRLKAEPVTPEAAEVCDLAVEREAEWAVVDGYQFDSEYQRRIKDAGLKLLFVDDTGQCEHYFADRVLNQNIYASGLMYSQRQPYTQLLLGPRYVLLRREFGRWRGCRREVPPVARRVLITMGGSDPANVTAQVLEAVRLLSCHRLEVMVVAGGSNPHLESLRKVIPEFPYPVRLETDVTNMPALMAWADVAVTAAGGTCYELALLQVPMLAITLAENQAAAARGLASHGTAIDAGWFDSLRGDELARSLQNVMIDRRLRLSLIENARRLVDGHGASHIVEALLQSCEEAEARLSDLRVGTG